jgi:hypothetical protein
LHLIPSSHATLTHQRCWPYLTSTGLPKKIEDAFHNFKYIPYTELCKRALARAAKEDDELIFNAKGFLTSKALNWEREWMITEIDWVHALKKAEEQICFHWGAIRANNLRVHHNIVIGLGTKLSWQLAVDYDMQQRDLAAKDPMHNLSMIDTVAVTILSARVRATQSIPPPKHARPASNSGSPPPVYHKRLTWRISKVHCFCCRTTGHLPKNCSTDITSAGTKLEKVDMSDRS